MGGHHDAVFWIFRTCRGIDFCDNLAACGIILAGVFAAYYTTSIIKAEHLSRENLYIGMSKESGFDNVPGPPVKCSPKGGVRKLLPDIELVKTYKPNEQIPLG